MVTTWDTANTGGTITFTNGNLTAQIGGTATGSTISSTSKPTGVGGGKYMFELTVYNSNATDYNFGLADSAENLNGSFGNDTDAIVVYVDAIQQGLVYFGGNNIIQHEGSSNAPCAVGSIVTFCVDLQHYLLWFTSPEARAHQIGGVNCIWNNTSTASDPGTVADPSANTGGMYFGTNSFAASSTSAIGSPVFICFNCDTPASSNPGVILNTGASPFSFTQNTSGFLPWDASGSFTSGPTLIWLD